MAPRNPFRPTFGIVPEIVAGRTGTVAQVSLSLDERPGSPYRFTLISGARGSGKTVLLNLLEKEAVERGWTPLRVTGSTTMLDKLVYTDLPKLLTHAMDSPERTQRYPGPRSRLSYPSLWLWLVSPSRLRNFWTTPEPLSYVVQCPYR